MARCFSKGRWREAPGGSDPIRTCQEPLTRYGHGAALSVSRLAGDGGCHPSGRLVAFAIPGPALQRPANEEYVPTASRRVPSRNHGAAAEIASRLHLPPAAAGRNSPRGRAKLGCCSVRSSADLLASPSGRGAERSEAERASTFFARRKITCHPKRIITCHPARIFLVSSRA